MAKNNFILLPHCLFEYRQYQVWLKMMTSEIKQRPMLVINQNFERMRPTLLLIFFFFAFLFSVAVIGVLLGLLSIQKFLKKHH